MYYCKYEDEFDGDIKGITYLEIDNGCVLRQLSIFPSKTISSNRKDDEYEFWLAEGDVNISDLSASVMEICKAEFDEVWHENNQPFLPRWIEIKETYSIGMNVRGKVQVFYPQGIIISLGKGIFALADYDETRSNSESGNLYPGHTAVGIVKGYDEVNMWIYIENVYIH